MADQTERIIIEIDGSSVKGDAQQVERAINTIGDAADKAGKKVNTAEKSINELGGALKTTGSSAKTTERDFQSLQSTIGNARPAQAQADALKQVANSAKQSASEMSNLGRTAGGGVGQIRGITSAATPAATAMSSLSGAAGLLVRALPLVGTAAAAINLTGLISQSTQLAARYETLGVVMNVVGKNAGYTSAEMERFDKSLQKTGISMAESRNNLAKMASANIDLANASKLARIAQDAAVIGNMNSSQAFQSLIYGIQSAQVEVLRTIGINVNFEQSYKKLADQLGKTSNELTEAEKTQARLNAVMEKAPSIAGAYEASMDTVGKKLGSTERLAENAKTMLGALFLPTWTAAVDAYHDALVRVNEELERIDVGKAQLLGRALADVFKQGSPTAVTPGGFMFEVWLNYQNQAEAANVTVKKSFFDTWAEIEKAGMNQSNRFIEVQAGLAAEVERANAETLESFRRASQTQLQKLTEDKEKFLAAAKGDKLKQAEIEKWYADKVAKLNEKSTKKFIDEQNKQEAARKKFIADAVKSAEGVQDMWLVKEKERMDVLSRSYDAMQQKEDELAKAREDAAAEALKIQEAQEKDAQKVMDRIQEGTADVFYDMFQNIEDGWSTLWDSMKNWALRTLAELAARAATVQIVVPIMTSMTGTANTAQAVQAITGGQGGGAAGMLGNLPFGSLFSSGSGGGMFSGIANSINVWGANTFPGMFAASSATTKAGMMALAANTSSPSASLAAAQAAQTAPTTTFLGGLGGIAGIGGGIYQMTQGGTGNIVGGAGTAIGGAMMFTPAAPFAPFVMLGSQLLGGLLGGKKEHSPSIIFQAQETPWGQTDDLQWHSKSKASWKMGNELAGNVGQVFGATFEQVEGMLGAYGDQYVDMLKDATVTWGRKAGGAWREWDFGTDMKPEELMEKVVADIQGQVFKAAGPAFSKVGEDFANSDAVKNAYALLENKTKQYGKLDAVIRAGVQDGNVEAYMEQLRAFQAAIANTSATWAAVSEASAQVVEPISQYEAAQRQLNAQYDQWIATLNALGIAQENIQKIEEDRTAALAKMAEDNAKAIQDVINAANEAVTPLSTLAAAQRQINAQFDGLAGQLRNLGAAAEYATQVEASRQAALAAAAAQQASALRYAQAELSGTVDQHKINEIAARYGWGEQYIKDGQINRENVQRDAIDWFKTASKQSVDAMEAHHGVEWQKISEDVKYLDSYFKKLDSASVQVATSHVRASTAVDKTTKAVDKTTDRLGDLAEALAEYRQSLIVGQDSALPLSARLAAAQAEYDRVSRLALAGDQDAAGNLSSVANQWLELSKESVKTQEDYGRTFGDVLRRVDLIVGKLSGQNVPGFAAGGFFSGGLRIVGEDGPELEATGPARIWNAEDTKRLLSGRSSDATASEVRALRDDLRAIGRALAKNTADTAKLMQRWDGDGMPEVRVA